MKKIIRKVLSGLLILTFLILVNFFDRNILDSMYLDAIDGGLLFNNVKEAEHIDYSRWSFLVSSGFFNTKYKKEYLREGYGIWVDYSDMEPNIYNVGAKITLSNNKVYIQAEYDYNTKLLTWVPAIIQIPKEIGESKYEMVEKAEEVISYLEEMGVTKADINESQNYVLKEVVLKTWAKGNWRFPFHLLRGVKVIDHTWDFPE